MSIFLIEKKVKNYLRKKNYEIFFYLFFLKRKKKNKKKNKMSKRLVTIALFAFTNDCTPDNISDFCVNLEYISKCKIRRVTDNGIFAANVEFNNWNHNTFCGVLKGLLYSSKIASIKIMPMDLVSQDMDHVFAEKMIQLFKLPMRMKELDISGVKVSELQMAVWINLIANNARSLVSWNMKKLDFSRDLLKYLKMQLMHTQNTRTFEHVWIDASSKYETTPDLLHHKIAIEKLNTEDKDAVECNDYVYSIHLSAVTAQ